MATRASRRLAGPPGTCPAGIGSAGTPAAPRRRGLPNLLAGERRAIFGRLVGNGVLQAAATLTIPLAVQSLATDGARWPLLLGLSAAAALLLLLRVVELVDAERLGQRYVTEVRLALFDAVVDGRSTSGHGVTMTRLLNDLMALKNWVGLGVARSCVAAIALAGCVGAAALLDRGLALVVLVPIVVTAIAAASIAAPLRRRVRAVRRERGRLANRLATLLLSLELVRAATVKTRSRSRIVQASRRMTQALEARMWPIGLLRALPQLVLPAVIVLVSVVPTGAASSDILIAVLLAGLAMGPLAAGARALEYHAAYDVARDRLTPALDAAGPRPDGRRTQPGWPPNAPTRRPTACLGPVDPWLEAPGENGDWVVVSDRQTLPAGSLAEVIDVTGRFKKSQHRLGQVIEACALDDPLQFPDGHATRLAAGGCRLPRSVLSRLRLARGAAMKTSALVIDDPMVTIDRACQLAIERLAGELKLTVLVAWVATVPVPEGWDVLQPQD